MDPRVRQYLDKKQMECQQTAKSAATSSRWEAYKRDVMLCAGLYDKVYSNVKTEEYCNSEWNPQSGTYLYFKQVPIEVTDQEFAEIQKYSAISFPE